MKTLTDLLQLVSKAIEQTNESHSGTLLKGENQYHVFFVDFSGHVNKLAIRYYSVYESLGENSYVESCTGKLDNEENIQELYWFLKNRLKG